MRNLSGMTNASTRPERIIAVLGPTNTGKTHYAVERMLAHVSGMIGLPLRLLAREVYDRIVAIRGADDVALMTGEEKIGSDQAPYIVATVEAMPIRRKVAFLAVDEIQLCADRERGHTFTDRLLHARGLDETMFLGSDTIRPLLKQLVPEAEVMSRPRFSTLSHIGQAKLNRLPRRSAIVAFSATDVYSLAEIMRRQKGGAAVVLGALSPRTRNSQVELYQSGEVDHLVATDAIGMGLNMDLTHVAFAHARKFDGRRVRHLTAPEIGQIAGRAGRYMADGTFGTTNSCGELDERMVEAVENHEFQSLKQIRWRNSALEFASIDHLCNSLDRPAPETCLLTVRDALDHRSLAVLARRQDIQKRATDASSVRLLWRVCQIPDFRKTLTDAHLHLLDTVFQHLTSNKAVLPNDWTGSMIAGLDRTDGDIDTLVNRLAHIRTWTFLSHRADWFDDPDHWQGLAREVEDRLSDALHQRLTQKFVDRRTSALLKSLREKGDFVATIDEQGDVLVDHHRVGAVTGFTFALAQDAVSGDSRMFASAARRAVARELRKLAAELIADRDNALELRGVEILWRGSIIARVVPGDVPLRLSLRLVATELLGDKVQKSLKQHLRQWIAKWLNRRIGDLQKLNTAMSSETIDAPARAIAARLVENLGHLSSETAGISKRELSDESRRSLTQLGVRFGVYHAFLPSLLKPAAQEALALLWALPRNLPLPVVTPGRTVLRHGELLDDAPLSVLGFVRLGKIGLRYDIAERLGAALREKGRQSPSFVLPVDLAASAGITRDELLDVAPFLGFRTEEKADNIFVSRANKRRNRRRPPRAVKKAKAMQGRKHSPFAALAVLKSAS